MCDTIEKWAADRRLNDEIQRYIDQYSRGAEFLSPSVVRDGRRPEPKPVSVISFGKNAKFLIGYEFKEPEPDTRNVLGDPFPYYKHPATGMGCDFEGVIYGTPEPVDPFADEWRQHDYDEICLKTPPAR